MITSNHFSTEVDRKSKVTQNQCCMVTIIHTVHPRINIWEQLCQSQAAFIRFLYSNFRYFLTLFSKFFASFPHGTCLLSVTHLLFSLRWNLPPNSSCNPKQLNSDLVHLLMISQIWKGVSPFWLPFSKGLTFNLRNNTNLHHNSLHVFTQQRFTFWTLFFSVALTKKIHVCFYSSAQLYA